MTISDKTCWLKSWCPPIKTPICFLDKRPSRNKNSATWKYRNKSFSNFSCMFLNPCLFSNLNYICSNLLDMRNRQERIKKTLCYQKLFWPFTMRINLKNVANSRPSASNFKSFSRSLEYFFLAVGQNTFGSKIPYFCSHMYIE